MNIQITENIHIKRNKTNHFYPLTVSKKLLKKSFNQWNYENYFYFYINLHLYLELAMNTSMKDFHEFYWHLLKPEKSEWFKKNSSISFKNKFNYFTCTYGIQDDKIKELINQWRSLSKIRNILMHTNPNGLENKFFNEKYASKYLTEINIFIDNWNSLENHLFDEFIFNHKNFNQDAFKSDIISFFYKLEKIENKKN